MSKTIKEKKVTEKRDKNLKKRTKSSFATNPKIELKKVSWPNKEVLLKSTLLIMAIILISTLYIMGLDLLFSNAFKSLKTIF